MNAPVSRCVTGEGVKVVASIQNHSSRDLRLKYCVYRKHSYYAEGQRKVITEDLLKEVGDVIPSGCHQTATRTITIPRDMHPSILNSRVIQAEYRLRVSVSPRLPISVEFVN